MSTYRELVYMVLDELKNSSDDRFFEEEHIIYLLDKWRAFLLKQRYSDIKKFVPDSNYQSICLDLIEVPAICGEPCEGGSYLRSTEKVPFVMPIGSRRVTPMDFFSLEIAYISRDRFRYVGYNRFLQNMIYATIAPDNYLYLKSVNPQYIYLEKVKFTGIFSDTIKSFDLLCTNGGSKPCDILDSEFPMEEALIPPIIELIVKELTGALYRPKDEDNNSNDDLNKVNVK